MTDSVVPVTVQLSRPAVDLAVGRYHACAPLDDGSLQCWGYGDEGVLGNGNLGNQPVPAPVNLPGPVQTGGLGVGYETVCAALVTGPAYCWGAGYSGGLGNGVIGSSAIPVAVSGLDDALDIEIGRDVTCAQRVGGEISCWGDNSYGQLGSGLTAAESRPTRCRAWSARPKSSAGTTARAHSWVRDRSPAGAGTTPARSGAAPRARSNRRVP